MTLLGYLIVSVIVAVMNGVISVHAYRRNTSTSRYIAYTSLFCIFVSLFYCISIVSVNRRVVSIASSGYFAMVTWMVVNLTSFAMAFTNIWTEAVRKKIRLGMYAVTTVDSLIMLINIFWEISVRYTLNNHPFAIYSYQKTWLYALHLALNYVLLAFVVCLLLYRFITVPRTYKLKYMNILLAIAVIVIVNAGFLFLPESNVLTLFDFSILGYALAVMFLYWNSFFYVERVLLNRFKSTIFDSLDEGIVLFDYEGGLMMYNRTAEKMLSSIRFDLMPAQKAFCEKCGIEDLEEKEEDSYAVQCYVESKGTQTPLRCYYTRMKNKNGQEIGNLYVFDDIAQETDILTGFHNWESFTVYALGNEGLFKEGTPVAVCDINGLSVINQMYSNSEGDRKIRNLAVLMREIFPKTCYFVRGLEAHLVILCHDMSEENVLKLLQEVKDRYDGSMQYAVSPVGYRASAGVIETIRDAEKGMQAKKLLDKDSIHSEMLTSLIRALEECDSDTEEHVERTQKMGAMLGERLGLTDVEQSNLALLCILHDIGKIGVPLEILNKPGKLTDAEWKTIQSHVEKGYQIAKSSKDLEGIANMIRFHHERWDGKGYPEGLTKETIPLLSRVISVVDAYDAMVNDRSYRKALSIEMARGELIRGAGSQFDPHIVSEYLSLLQSLDADPQYQGIPGIYNSVSRPEEVAEAEEAAWVAAGESTPHDPSKASGQASLSKEEIVVPKEARNNENIQTLIHTRYIVDEMNHIISVDDNFEQLTGYSAEDVERNHMTQSDLLPEEDRTDYFLLTGEQLQKTSSALVEHRIKCKDGNIIQVFCYGRNYYDPTARAGRGEIIVTNINSTNAVQSMQRMVQTKVLKDRKRWEEMAHRDSLTELLNRAAFESAVELQLVKKNYRILFLMMDLDHFKQYNDTYGHKAGDEYLMQMAEGMREAVREKDLLCRIGGDEFAAAILLPKAFTDEAAEGRIERIYTTIQTKLTAAEGGGGVSMGAILTTKEMVTFNELYKAADKALYQAKEGGRGKYVIYGQN